MAIVGIGSIGTEVAKRAKHGFGMRVIGFKRDPRQVDSATRAHVDEVYGTDRLEDILPTCDYVV